MYTHNKAPKSTSRSECLLPGPYMSSMYNSRIDSSQIICSDRQEANSAYQICIRESCQLEKMETIYVYIYWALVFCFCFSQHGQCGMLHEMNEGHHWFEELLAWQKNNLPKVLSSHGVNSATTCTKQ